MLSKYFVSWTYLSVDDFQEHTRSDIATSEADNLEDLIEDITKQIKNVEKISNNEFVNINMIIPEHQMFNKG